MFSFSKRMFASAALLLSASALNAQIYKLHNADVAFQAEGQFTTPLTSQGPADVTTNNSVGALVTLRDHPVAWAGVEINAGYTDYQSQYHTTAGTTDIKTEQVELTGGYLFHIHTPFVQPFVAIGGGALDLIPNTSSSGQWRGAGMYDVGMDFDGHHHGPGAHLGLRIEEHGLIYRAANFDVPQLQARTWVNQSSPTVGVYVKW